MQDTLHQNSRARSVWRLLAPRLLAIAIIFGVLMADQFTKWLMVHRVFDEHLIGFWPWLIESGSQSGFEMRPILPFFNLVLIWNSGISFGLLDQIGADNISIFVILKIIITLIFFGWALIARDRFERIGLAMIVGGGLGNILDRVRFGAVIDFLDFTAFGWHYPAFNLADSFITIGVVLMGYYLLFRYDQYHH